MKLIITILRDIDENIVTRGLTAENIRVTRIASTGSLFRRGSSTLLIGVEDEEVEHAMQVIRDNLTPAIEPGIKRATLFVLDVDAFERL